MKTVKMTYKNKSNKIVEKEIEENVVSIYQSMGWEVKKEKPIQPEKPSFTKKNIPSEEE